jgi:hypothetical protein
MFGEWKSRGDRVLSVAQVFLCPFVPPQADIKFQKFIYLCTIVVVSKPKYRPDRAMLRTQKGGG